MTPIPQRPQDIPITPIAWRLLFVLGSWIILALLASAFQVGEQVVDDVASTGRLPYTTFLKATDAIDWTMSHTFAFMCTIIVGAVGLIELRRVPVVSSIVVIYGIGLGFAGAFGPWLGLGALMLTPIVMLAVTAWLSQSFYPNQLPESGWSYAEARSRHRWRFWLAISSFMIVLIGYWWLLF